MFILESGKSTSGKIKLKFNLDGKNFEFEGSYRDILRSVANFCFERDYQFENIHDEKYVSDKIKEKSFSMSSFHKLPNGKFLSGFDHANKYNIVRISTKWLSSVGKLESINLNDESAIEPIVSFSKFKDDKKSVQKMTFAEAAQLILKQNNNKPMTSHEIWIEVESQGLVETSGKTPWDSMNAKMILYSENTTAIGKKKNSIFRIIEDRPYKFTLINPNSEVQPVPDELDNSDILPPSKFIKFQEKPNVKNPFGCKDKDGEETSTLCIIGKSGSGKTTSTEIALETMKHEYLLYIPIEGEYTFSQYTGEEFEMSSLGEFIMMAQNDLGKCYTVIFDECHRPITISKLNTDLLQALSSRRNRGGERFVTMDRSTKRMYTSSTDEFPITLKAVSGKLLVPDNFGIVCLSSNPSVICRNDDFLNRVDLVVFHESDRNVKDLTKLKKLEPNEKNIESIRGLLLSDGKQI